MPKQKVSKPDRWERMAEKYIPVTESGCWIWLNACNQKGYGQVQWEGRFQRAHRVLYEIHKGPISVGYQIDHLCRVPSCVNPDHLEMVTGKENTLRGTAPAACNARKTHCINGHPLVGDNVYLKKDGARNCRICRRETQKKYYHKVEATQITGRCLMCNGKICTRNASQICHDCLARTKLENWRLTALQRRAR